MAPLTQSSFDDYAAASIWPRPTFLLVGGSVTFLILILRRQLIRRRYLRYVNASNDPNYASAGDIKYKTDEDTPLSELPPPLRSIYYHQEGIESNKSSSILAAEAALRETLTSADQTISGQALSLATAMRSNRRHSCPYPASALGVERVHEKPPLYSELLHDSVEFFPVADEEGVKFGDETESGTRETEGKEQGSRSGYWRRRTLIYA